MFLRLDTNPTHTMLSAAPPGSTRQQDTLATMPSTEAAISPQVMDSNYTSLASNLLHSFWLGFGAVELMLSMAPTLLAYVLLAVLTVFLFNLRTFGSVYIMVNKTTDHLLTTFKEWIESKLEGRNEGHAPQAPDANAEKSTEAQAEEPEIPNASIHPTEVQAEELTIPDASIHPTEVQTEEPTIPDASINPTESKTEHPNKFQRPPLSETHTLVKEFEASNFQPCMEDVHSGRSFEVLCTYEWKRTSLDKEKKEQPVIYVPGFGRRFMALSMPHKLMPDSGSFWRDQHVYRVFHQQFEPLFQAVNVMNPGVKFNDVDVVIGRSNFLLLLSWVQGNSTQPFMMQVKTIKNTIFFHGTSGLATAQPKSFGRNFEEDFTEAVGESDADGYHRAVRFNLGPITLVVRLEVDAFLDCEDEPVHEMKDALFHGHRTVDASNHDAGIRHAYATSVVLGGRYVPHSQITELKLQKEKYDQLWAGNYNTKVIADTNSGGFAPVDQLSRKVRQERQKFIQKNTEEDKARGSMTVYGAEPRDARVDWTDWEQEKTEGFQKLVGFFKDMKETMDQVEGGKAILQRSEKNKKTLELFQGDEEMADALPQEIVKIFWN